MEPGSDQMGMRPRNLSQSDDVFYRRSELRVDQTHRIGTRVRLDSPNFGESMWPQNGNSDPQVDFDTAAEWASKYLPFRMYMIPICSSEECVCRTIVFHQESGISTLTCQSRASIVLSGCNPFILIWRDRLELSFGAIAHSNWRSLWQLQYFRFWKQRHLFPVQEFDLFEGDTAVETHIARLRRLQQPLAAWRVRRSWYMERRNFILTYFHLSIKTFHQVFSFLGIPFSVQLRITRFCLFNAICLRHVIMMIHLYVLRWKSPLTWITPDQS